MTCNQIVYSTYTLCSYTCDQNSWCRLICILHPDGRINRGLSSAPFFHITFTPFSSDTYQILHSYLSSSSLIPLECLSPTASSVQSPYHFEFAMYVCLSQQFVFYLCCYIYCLYWKLRPITFIQTFSPAGIFLSADVQSEYLYRELKTVTREHTHCKSRYNAPTLNQACTRLYTCMHIHKQMPCPSDRDIPHSNGM
jgi:hypothetical protein